MAFILGGEAGKPQREPVAQRPPVRPTPAEAAMPEQEDVEEQLNEGLRVTAERQ